MSLYSPYSDESEVCGTFIIDPAILHLYRGPPPYVPAKPSYFPDISSDQDSPNSTDESETYIINPNPSYAPISPYVYNKPSSNFISCPCVFSQIPDISSQDSPSSTDESETFIINPTSVFSSTSDPFHFCRSPPPYVYSPSSNYSQSRAKLSMLSTSNKPSYAMVASSRGCRRVGLLPKQYRQGGSSSSSHKTCRQGDKTYLAIFCPSNMNHLLLIRVSLHSLLLTPNNKNILSYDLKKHYTSMSCLHPFKLPKDFIDLLPAGSPHDWYMCAVCTSSSVVSGLGPFIFLFNSRSNSKEVFRYNLHQPNMRFHRCADIPAAICDTLYVQIGDFLYALSYAGQPVLQKYDIEKDIWTLVKDNIITRCTYTDQNNRSMNHVPHVVINGKLHIWFGYNSFAFDTQTDTWEYSNLFDTFWSHHNPFNFYGQHFWGQIDSANWEFAKRSFGFYGRGIVWDEDILLGVLRSPKCQLVAFQLIDNKVVKSQSFTFADHEFEGAKLVDLGQGYIGLLHFTTSFFPPTDSDFDYQLELVTILVSKPLQPRDDCFLECRIVRKDIVAQNLYYNMNNPSSLFSV